MTIVHSKLSQISHINKLDYTLLYSVFEIWSTCKAADYYNKSLFNEVQKLFPLILIRSHICEEGEAPHQKGGLDHFRTIFGPFFPFTEPKNQRFLEISFYTCLPKNHNYMTFTPSEVYCVDKIITGLSPPILPLQP